MKKEYVGLIVILIVLIAVLGAFVLYNQWPLLSGKKIVLATQPVDPFDPLRGQYMVINYEISRLNNTENLEAGNAIYVLLKQDAEGIWRKTDISGEKPTVGDFVKGNIIERYGETIRIEYGIEQYFFERNAELPTRNITVEVSVASSGRAKIIQLLENGEPVEIDYEDFDIRA